MVARISTPYQANCDKVAARRLFAQVQYLRAVSPAALDALVEAAVCLRYPAGAAIFLEGAPTAGLFAVEQGIVKISRVSLEGREYIMHFAEPGTTFNDVSALDGGPNPANATAFLETTLWLVEPADLQRLARAYPDLAWALIEDLAARARAAVSRAQDLAMRSVRGRLARLLLEETARRDSDVVQRFLTQEDMAAKLGTVREVVGRALRSLAADGIIQFDRHRILILDPDRLAREAEV